MGGLVRRLAMATLRRVVNLLLIIPSVIRCHAPFRTSIVRTTSFAEHPSIDYAVVALYPRNGLTISVRNLIAALARNRVNVILVSNRTLADADREALSGQVATLIERENLGRD